MPQAAGPMADPWMMLAPCRYVEQRRQFASEYSVVRMVVEKIVNVIFRP